MTQTCDLASKGQDVLPREECHAPAEFAPHLLLGENAAQAADIHALVSDCSKQSNSEDYTTSLLTTAIEVASFDTNKVAVVFRDISKDHLKFCIVLPCSAAAGCYLNTTAP